MWRCWTSKAHVCLGKSGFWQRYGNAVFSYFDLVDVLIDSFLHFGRLVGSSSFVLGLADVVWLFYVDNLFQVFTTFEELGISVDVVATSEVSISLTLDPSKLWERALIEQASFSCSPNALFFITEPLSFLLVLGRTTEQLPMYQGMWIIVLEITFQSEGRVPGHVCPSWSE